MPHTRFTAEETVARGKELYEREIRQKVEAGNHGKYLVIDIETGEYELDEDRFAATERAAARHPDNARYAMRIGYRTMGRIGPSLREVKS